MGSHSDGQKTMGNSSPLARWMVRTWTAAASDSSRRLRSSSVSCAGLGDPAAQPGGQRTGSEVLVTGGPVQELADVAQVGELALPVDEREHPARELLRPGDDLLQRGDPALAQHLRPGVEPAVHGLPRGLVGLGDPQRSSRGRR